MLQTDVSGDCWLELFTPPALSVFFMDNEITKEPEILPARLVGSAYDPTESFEETFFNPVNIYAVGSDEYLVQAENKFKNGKVIASKVRLDQAKKIKERPFDYETGEPTRKISEMTLSTDISPEAMESLLAISKLRRKNTPDHKAEFILPEPN